MSEKQLLELNNRIKNMEYDLQNMKNHREDILYNFIYELVKKKKNEMKKHHLIRVYICELKIRFIIDTDLNTPFWNEVLDYLKIYDIHVTIQEKKNWEKDNKMGLESNKWELLIEI